MIKLSKGQCNQIQDRIKAKIVNEETLKNNVVVPLLRSLGFNVDGLTFEDNFQIRLGHGVYRVGTRRTKGSKTAKGRLDVLCRNGKQNIVVVEVKAPSESLSEDDVSQAVSYARLLEPIAPFALITNGKVSWLYNSLSRERLDKIPSGSCPFVLDLNEEAKLRYEALSWFTGYSRANLHAFCVAHNAEKLSKFRSKEGASLSEQLKFKYIPSVYIKRNLEEYFVKFLNQNEKYVFPVIGEAGTGKTVLLCHLLDMNQDIPKLFYSGTLLPNSLLQTICHDFNLIFSPQESEISLLKKIASLSVKHDEPFIFILDAIDEWGAQDSIVQINSLISAFAKLGIKVCISCKPDIWSHFLSHKGIDTDLSRQIFADVPQLADFTAHEVREAEIQYSKFLKVKHPGNFRVGFINPFLLRMAFEVAYHDKLPYTTVLRTKMLVRRYLEFKLAKCDRPEVARRVMIGLAQALLEHGQVQVTEETLRILLQMGPLALFPDDLFHYNLLYNGNIDGKVSVGFYFSVVRDYLIVAECLHLESKSTDMAETLSKCLGNLPGESALLYYLSSQTPVERNTLLRVMLQTDRRGDDLFLRMITIMKFKLSVSGRGLELAVGRRLREIMNRNRDNSFIAQRVAYAIARLPVSAITERLLLELFEDILTIPDAQWEFASHWLSQMLGRYDTSNITERLIELASDDKNSGYVRRYIIDALRQRQVKDRKGLFLRLVVDKNPNVRTWVRCWYSELETKELRNRLLDIASNGSVNDNCVVDIFLILGRSRYRNTARMLCEQLERTNYSEHVRAWLCRSIAQLGYKRAVPKFIEMLEKGAKGELLENLIISLGDLRDQRAVPIILKGIESLSDPAKRKGPKGFNLYSTWLSHAAIQLNSTKLRKRLWEIVSGNGSRYAVYISALSLARAANNAEIIDLLDLIGSRRLLNWQSRAVLEEIGLKSVRKNADIPINKVTFSIDIIERCYNLCREDDRLSAMILIILLQHDNDTDRLSSFIKLWLPESQGELPTREAMLLCNENIRINLRLSLLPWLNKFLMRDGLSRHVLKNALELALAVGDHSTAEVLRANRACLQRVLGEEMNEIEYVENEILKLSGTID